MNEITFVGDVIGLSPEGYSTIPGTAVPRRNARRVVMAALSLAGVFLTAVIAVNAWRDWSLKRCEANLKRLGLACHDYHEAHGHFPAPTLARGDGTPLLSWRVAILPYLGHRSLYDRFHLDEPWNSPHNRSLLAEMPSEFACPGAAGETDGRTGYKVVVGPAIDPYTVSTPFDARRGVDLREITDGTSNTVLILETDSGVPWTSPDDLHWSPGGPLPRLSSPHKGGAHAVFADGMTRFVKQTTEANILLAILTANGGEVLGGG